MLKLYVFMSFHVSRTMGKCTGRHIFSTMDYSLFFGSHSSFRHILIIVFELILFLYLLYDYIKFVGKGKISHSKRHGKKKSF